MISVVSSQSTLQRDFLDPEKVVSECSTCGAPAYVDPRLHEDGFHRDDGRVIAVEFKCENNHCFSEVVNHPESDVRVKEGELDG